MANMEVSYRPSSDLLVKVECRGVEEMFQALAPLQEVLGDNTKCGRCGGTRIRLCHRKADGHDVYELLCTTPNEENNNIPCNSRLALGKNKDNNLFPRRYEQEKNEDGKWVPKANADGERVWLPHNGWVRWDNKQKKYV